MKLFQKIIIVFSVFSLPVGVFASVENPPTDTISPNMQSYDFYMKNAQTACDGSENAWNQHNSLLPIPQYPELSANAVNAQMERAKNLQNISDEERAKLLRELSSSRIGNFSGFKTLEVARLQYRATMNSIFACGIVSSRLLILSDLREKIAQSTSTRKSEITNQLDREQRRLENERDKLKCNSAGPKNTDIMTEMVNSSTRQYCHYRHYLSYLDSNLEANRYMIEQIEKKVGEWDGTKEARTTSEWVESYNKYALSLDREIARADATLPRAMRAYQEMERAYPVHLMLTIIYDDFIRLRANLSTYMNASTQTYLKAYNAQDANNR